jgi:hypothetical protein
VDKFFSWLVRTDALTRLEVLVTLLTLVNAFYSTGLIIINARFKRLQNVQTRTPSEADNAALDDIKNIVEDLESRAFMSKSDAP